MKARATKALIVSALCLAALAPAAQAEFGITGFSGATNINRGSVGIVEEASRQAGAHADLVTDIRFPATPSNTPDGAVKTITIDLPPGAVGNPNGIPTCTAAELVGGPEGKTPNCPVISQVGFVEVFTGGLEPLKAALFNMERPAGLPGLFAFNFSGFIMKIEPRVRGNDYGVSATATNISEAEIVLGTRTTFWGVPADPSHDFQRYDWTKRAAGEFPFGAANTDRRRPFLTNPTSCSPEPLVTHGSADSWQNPGAFFQTSFDTDLEGTPFIYDGCERLPFDPRVAVLSGTHRAAAPTGLDITIKVPQLQDPYGVATAHVKKIVTELPPGMAPSPSAVAGLGACSLAEINLGSNDPPTCPDSAKIGNVTVRTPLLKDPLEGEVILARQKENPFGSTFAVYLVAQGPGFYLKIPGELNVDKQTGRTKTVFSNLPQQPFEEAHLDFRGGPTAPLTTPDVCGTYKTRTEITSWASPDPIVIEAPMLIDENCTGGGSFKPSLQAGVANPVAGAKSPLTIRIKRQDGEQNISRFDITLPEGELASLKGLDVCSDAAAPSGNCPKGSQVGISTTAIGTGAFPLFVPQPGKDPTALYLAGPYKGSPYSLIAKVPAQSGPFDFGNIVVRTAINLNPVTAQVIAESDPLPQILEGVPIQYRDVRIEVQKPDFTINPTSCEQRSVKTKIYSSQGAVATPSVPTKVGDCGALSFGPKLAFQVKGGTNRGDFQALKATLTTGKKEANISRVAVTLPHSEFLEQSHIGTVCTRVQFAAKKCPAASVYGFARAVTPLLDKPLEGPVYLRSSNHSLPDMVAQLNGQFDIELAGRIDSVNERIRNTFELVPDAPVTKFTLTLQGGKKSLLVNSRNLCVAPSRADVKMIGQNGKRHNERPVVKNSCSKRELRKARAKARTERQG